MFKCVISLSVRFLLFLLLVVAGDVERNPGPLSKEDIEKVSGEELSEKDLYEVLDEVIELQGEWISLFAGLRLPPNQLSIIKTEHNGNTLSCLHAVLLVWLSKSYDVDKYGPPSWRTLVKGVAAESGGAKVSLACKIAKNHPDSQYNITKQQRCEDKCSEGADASANDSSDKCSDSLSGSNPELDQEGYYGLKIPENGTFRAVDVRQQAVEYFPQSDIEPRNIDNSQLLSCYECGTDLTRNLGRECECGNEFPFLHIKNLSLYEGRILKEELKEETHCMKRKFNTLCTKTCVWLTESKVSVPTLCLSVRCCGKHVGNLIQYCKDPMESFNVLDEHNIMNFFNYGVLEDIITGISLAHNEHLISELRVYKDAFKVYVKRRIFHMPITALSGCTDHCKQHLTLKTDDNWMPKKLRCLQDLIKLQVQISVILNLKKCDIVLAVVIPGCVKLVYSIPPLLLQQCTVFPLSPVQQDALSTIGITRVSIGRWNYILTAPTPEQQRPPHPDLQDCDSEASADALLLGQLSDLPSKQGDTLHKPDKAATEFKSGDTMVTPSHSRLVCELCLMEYGHISDLFDRGCFFPNMHENASRMVIPASGRRAPSIIHKESRVTKPQARVRPVPSVPVIRFCMCNFLPPQVCRMGDKCTFPHSSEELRAWNNAKRRTSYDPSYTPVCNQSHMQMKPLSEKFEDSQVPTKAVPSGATGGSDIHEGRRKRSSVSEWSQELTSSLMQPADETTPTRNIQSEQEHTSARTVEHAIETSADTMASPSHGRLVCEQCLMEHGRTQGLFLYGCFLPYLHENTSRLVIPTNGPRGPSNIPAKSRVTKQQEYVRPVPSIPVFHFRLCKFLPPQVCRWGDKCTFPHSSVELRAWNDAKRRITDGTSKKFRSHLQQVPSAGFRQDAVPIQQVQPTRSPVSSHETSVYRNRYEFLDRVKEELYIEDITPELTVANYKEKFRKLLCWEEKEHITALRDRCDNFYSLEIFVDSLPRHISKRSIREDKKYGFLNVKDGDVIAYATQASEAVYLIIHDGKGIQEIKAEILRDNYNHTENKMYISMDKNLKVSNFYEEVEAEFEVKHSFFSNLHEVLQNLPDEIVKRIMPSSEQFREQVRTKNVSTLNSIPKEYADIFHFDKMEDNLLEAYQVALSCQSGAPPVLISGAFGTGKTCFLSSIAYCFISEANRSGVPARVLICAHHQASADTILHDYFGPMLEHKTIPLKLDVIRVTSINYRISHSNKYASRYRTIREFKQGAHHYHDINKTFVVITTFLTSLHLKEMFRTGFFTHILIDEGAQAREPEAVAPLCLADKRTKIIIAGDSHQVGPALLVLGKEARENGLKVSLLERLQHYYEKIGDRTNILQATLRTCFRCQEHILKFASKLFYDSHVNVNQPHPEFPYPLVFVCTSDREIWNSDASVNQEEANLLMKHLMDDSKRDKIRNVCVLSSSRGQVTVLAKLRSKHHLEQSVNVLPTFNIQGQEYDSLYISTYEPTWPSGVTRNPTKSICNPFVFNTAITRAKLRIVSFGNPYLLLSIEKYMIEKYKRKGYCWSQYLKSCLIHDSLILPNTVRSSEKDNYKIKLKQYLESYTSGEAATFVNTDVTDCKSSASLLSIDSGVDQERMQIFSKSDVTEATTIVDETKKQIQEFDFVKQPTFKFLCPVTYDLLLKPQQTTCCGQHLSEEAAIRIQRDRKRCPLCTKPSWTTHPDKYFRRQVHELLVFCPHKKSGCKWKGELGDLKYHVETCPTKDSPALCLHEHVYGAEIVATTTLQVVPGELDHEWKDHGLRLLIPADVLELNALPMTISIQASVNGYYQLPKETELVSGVYWIEFPGKLSRPITLELQHCASLEPSKLSLVKFVTAKCNQDILPYNFELVTGGKFSSNSSYGRVEMYISSGFAIIREYDGRKRYRLLTYYIPHAPTMWQLHLVLICDLQLYLQDVKIHYSRKKAEVSQSLQVTFDRDRVTLDLIKEGVTLPNGWALIPEIYPAMILKEIVDSYKPGREIPFCQVQLHCSKEEPPESLEHELKLTGIRDHTFITISRIPTHHGAHEEKDEPSNTIELDEADLLEVSDYLLPLDKAQIHGLGLVLGLSHIRLKRMRDCNTFLEDVVHAWLTGVDRVAERGGVSWGTLVTALRHSRVGRNTIADRIEHEKNVT